MYRSGEIGFCKNVVGPVNRVPCRQNLFAVGTPNAFEVGT